MTFCLYDKKRQPDAGDCTMSEYFLPLVPLCLFLRLQLPARPRLSPQAQARTRAGPTLIM